MDGRRVAWVTGAGGALGAAVVGRLADEGYVGVASVRRNGGTLPPDWREHTGDLTQAAVAEQAVALALGTFGRLDLAVLAAGAWEGGAPIQNADADAFGRQMAANGETAWQSARAAASALARPGGARGPRALVLVAAFGALARPAPMGQAAYRAAKAAVVGLAEAMATDLAASGVSVFALAPTTLRTEANRQAMPGADAAAWIALDEVAALVAFLATAPARILSGAVLPLDGRVRPDRP